MDQKYLKNLSATQMWEKKEHSKVCTFAFSPPYLSMCVGQYLCVTAFSHMAERQVSMRGHSYICAAASSPVGEQFKRAPCPIKHKQINLIRQETA